MENRKSHWETIYSTKSEQEVSWFQEYPKTSMMFLELFDLPLDANIIDIGGGDSHFVDALLGKRLSKHLGLGHFGASHQKAEESFGRKGKPHKFRLLPMLRISSRLFNLTFGTTVPPFIF